MLFDVGAHILESEKERNLYYKFFAGYFFNELISDLDSRVASFSELLRAVSQATETPLPDDFVITSEQSHVSFDNHAYLMDIDDDRGEFADILVHDRAHQVLVLIEAKLRTDWTSKKDIEANAKRYNAIAQRLPTTRIVPCLLVTEAKWKAVKRLIKHPGSNYTRWLQLREQRPLVITWQQLLACCRQPEVRSFLQYQLGLSDAQLRYDTKDGIPRRIGT